MMLLTLLALLMTKLFPLYSAIDWTPPSPFFRTPKENGVYSLSMNREGDTVIGFFNSVNGCIEFSGYDFLENRPHLIPINPFPCSSEVSFLQIISTKDANLFALWIDEEGYGLKASCFQDQSGDTAHWMDPLAIKGTNPIQNPKLGCDQKGNALVIWEEFNGYDVEVKMTYFSRLTESWSSPIVLSTMGSDCHSSQLAVDDRGRMVIAWCSRFREERNQNGGLHAIRIELEPFTSTELFSFFDSHFSLSHPNIGFGPDKTIYLVWEKTDGLDQSTMIQSLPISADLKRQGNIRDISGKNASSVSVRYFLGELCALWITSDGVNERLQCRELTDDRSAIKNIAPPLCQIDGYQTCLDEHGKMRIILFNKDQIHISLFDESWIETRLYDDTAHHSEVSNVQIESDTLGNTLITWTQGERIFYSRGDYLLPPLDFSVMKINKRFPAKIIVRAYLTWKTAKNTSIVAYRIRRNHEVLDDVCEPVFIDRCCPKGQLIYSISSINNKGLESQFSEVLLNN